MNTSERFFQRIRKRALALFSTFVLALIFASLSQLGEYSVHRTATAPTPDRETVQNREPEAVVPDSPAENSETVLIGPNPEIRDRLLSLIRTAKSEFLLNVYLLTEPSVVEALVSAKKRGVDVRVILEKDPYRLPGANRKARDQLLSAGIEVFSSKDAFAFVHAKYAVADGNSYVFSTGNYTKTTFAKNREFFIF
jgi:phosphatidylserine/phosphatidylglycerophosphate/cardiolipin synthase-like enzyme